MKLDRLISILVMLLRKERVQAKELAQIFDVSPRTILRDIDAINLAGIPIVTYQGANGGIGIAEGYRLDRSVLTMDEMAAIITVLKGMSRTIHDKKHEVLIEKFKNTLSPLQLASINSKADKLVLDLSPWGGDEAIKETMGIINKAIENSREIQFSYTDQAGSRTNRRVEPYSLVLKAQKWYMYGWCSSRGDFRLFKLSRMKDISITDIPFTPRQVSLNELPWEKKWQQPQNMVALELLFEREMEGIVREWFGEDVIEDGDGRIMAHAALPENNWLYGFLLSFGSGVEVISPPHIRTILAGIAGEIHKKYYLET